jgi:hypothetical protein
MLAMLFRHVHSTNQQHKAFSPTTQPLFVSVLSTFLSRKELGDIIAIDGVLSRKEQGGHNCDRWCTVEGWCSVGGYKIRLLKPTLPDL